MKFIIALLLIIIGYACPATSQVPPAGAFMKRFQLSDADPNVVRRNLNLPSGSVYFPAVCDNTTDNGPGLRALIALYPNNYIDIPGCAFGIGGDENGNGIKITTSNTTIRGVTRNGLATQTFAASDYLTGNQGSVMFALPSLTNTFVTFDPAAGTDGIKGGGIINVVIAAMNRAAVGLIAYSAKGLELLGVIVEKANTTGAIFGASSNSLLNPNSGQTQFIEVEQLSILEGWAANPNATGLILTGGTGTDVSLMNWGQIYISHRAGIGLDCIKADSNNINSLIVYGNGTTGNIGYHLMLRSSMTAPACRYNEISIMTSVTPGSVDPGSYAQGNATANSGGNYYNMLHLNQSQANNALSIPLTMEQTNQEYPAAYFITYAGVTNISNGNSANMFPNGDYLSDARSANTSSTPLTLNGFVFDEVRAIGNITTGAASFQIKQVSVSLPGVAARAATSTVILQTLPAPGDYINLCNRVEGADTAALGWGNSKEGAPKNIIYSFWDYGLAGTYAVYFGNADLTRTLVKTWVLPVSNTWTYITLSIPGDSTGNWLKASGTIGIQVCRDLGAGSTFQTPNLGVWQTGNFHTTSSATQFINQAVGTIHMDTNGRLYPGLTDIPYIAESVALKNNKLRRNYFNTFLRNVLPTNGVQLNSTIGVICTLPEVSTGQDIYYLETFPVEMALTPNIVFYNPWSATPGSWRLIPTGGSWTLSTVYSIGTIPFAVQNNNNIYILDTAGTSAATGGGPSGTTTTANSIVDGSSKWHYLMPAYGIPVLDPLSLIPGGLATASRNSILFKFTGATPQGAMYCGHLSAGGGV